jgi:flagellar hook-associated protein 2
MASSPFQVAGLASGFDWKSFIDQIMDVERVPALRMEAEKSINNQKAGLLDALGTRLSALQDAARALRTSGAFARRTATSATTGSTWKSTAGAETPVGAYRIAVTQLATTAALTGRTAVAAPLATTGTGVADLSVATLPIAQAVSAGTFSINGQKVTVALTDSLQDVFDAISSATSGDVTASYDPEEDKITLTSASGSLMLGAANDTSNLLTALKLGNSGTGTVTSASKLGALKTTASLAGSNLAAGLAADPEGNGSFAINGVSISYNVNTDTLSAVLKRINEAGTGVNAAYDGLNDRVVLANTVTGDLGIAVGEDAGGLLAALGLTGGAVFARGINAEFSVNGGETHRSASNTLTASAHGIAGLSVTVDTDGTQTLTVAADTSAMREKIETFVTKFNEVQQFIDANTRITTDAKGKVTAASLASNREIQEWARSLRGLAFGAIGGITGSIKRLDDLGLDFKRGSSELEIVDASKLNAALSGAAGAAATFFEMSSTGFAAQIEDFIDRVSARNKDQRQRLDAANNSLTEQIAAVDRRLLQQRELLESAFLQMERAQSMIKQQQSALDLMFSSKK